MTRRRWLAATGMAVLAATGWLAGCSVFRSEYTFSQSQLQDALARKFPFNKRYMEVFDIQLANPQLALDSHGTTGPPPKQHSTMAF